jgi:hypothetical protein
LELGSAARCVGLLLPKILERGPAVVEGRHPEIESDGMQETKNQL